MKRIPLVLKSIESNITDLSCMSIAMNNWARSFSSRTIGVKKERLTGDGDIAHDKV